VSLRESHHGCYCLLTQNLSALTVQGAVAALDTAGVSSALDIGGADGQFVLKLMAVRSAAVAGDFFEVTPAGTHRGLT
jgi:hypothetical protein